MKRVIFLCICLLLCLTSVQAKRTVKIACVGNSITYGAGIANREKNSYPAQLQYYLGENYEIRNFGQNGTTVLTQGDHPYVQTKVYKDSKEFLPDIVLIKLGTNDTKPQNWKYKEQFAKDYQALNRHLPGASLSSANYSAHTCTLFSDRTKHHQSTHHRERSQAGR